MHHCLVTRFKLLQTAVVRRTVSMSSCIRMVAYYIVKKCIALHTCDENCEIPQLALRISLCTYCARSSLLLSSRASATRTCGCSYTIPRSNTETDNSKVQVSTKEEIWHLAGTMNGCIPPQTTQWQMGVKPLFQNRIYNREGCLGKTSPRLSRSKPG